MSRTQDHDDVPAISVRGVVKDYPGVRALDGVDLDVARGEVHGLVGENGAGKSTLMKLVAGAIGADAGTVRVLGRELTGGDPRAAADAGLAMIYQELTILPEMTAGANVLLGRWPVRTGWFARRTARQAYRAVAEELNVEIPFDTLAGRLSTAQQQQLEIMRALASDRQVVVMDEPTASLGAGERESLRGIVDHLRGQGRSVVYISHDLGEVLRVSDQVTVMRDGRLVETRPAAEWTEDDLVKAMVGHSTGLAEVAPPRGARDVKPVVRVRGLSAGGVRIESLELRGGEILGVAGLVGSGRSEMLRALAGADPGARGELEIDGKPCRWPRSVAAGLRYGIALAPEDRKTQGLVLEQSAATNVAIADLKRPAHYGFLTQRAIAAAARESVEAVSFDPNRLGQPAGTFSGGNQQKVLLARWLYRPPRVLLLDEPTRGIDIAAKAEIFATMRKVADGGTAVVMVSSELEEVVEHADRIIVLAGGELVAELGSEASEDEVLAAAFRTGVSA